MCLATPLSLYIFTLVPPPFPWQISTGCLFRAFGVTCCELLKGFEGDRTASSDWSSPCWPNSTKLINHALSMACHLAFAAVHLRTSSALLYHSSAFSLGMKLKMSSCVGFHASITIRGCSLYALIAENPTTVLSSSQTISLRESERDLT